MSSSSSSSRPTELPLEVEVPMFVYVKLPGHIDPTEREESFGEPVAAALEASGTGSVTGGGSLLSEPDKEGNRTIEYCGLDIDLTRPRKGIAILIEELRRLGAPSGTILEFRVDDESFEVPIYGRSH